jgi:hypothetical protein
MGHEAWLTTLDGTTTGSLVVRTQRPNRPDATRPGQSLTTG